MVSLPINKYTLLCNILLIISYVTVDTESDSNSTTTPSTAKQWDLANQLVEELKQIGMQDVTIDDKAYIMATLPNNVTHEVLQ
jgi:tripeptide aminopeptidase